MENWFLEETRRRCGYDDDGHKKESCSSSRQTSSKSNNFKKFLPAIMRTKKMVPTALQPKEQIDDDVLRALNESSHLQVRVDLVLEIMKMVFLSP